MKYIDYIKKEVERLLFIETNKDLTFKIKNSFVLKKGEYPINVDNLKDMALNGTFNINLSYILDGIITILGVDENFKYKDDYFSILKSIQGIESYIISQIEANREKNIKKSLIYANTLIKLSPKESNLINRIYLLFDIQQKTGLDFKDEIEKSLKEVLDINPDNPTANYNLALLYLNNDNDLAKYHLRKCLQSPTTKNEAQELLEKIEIVESFDKAVDLIKSQQYRQALAILIPLIEQQPENLNAIYYTALCYRNLNANQKALYYLNMLKGCPERPEVFVEIGLNLASLGYFEEALKNFKDALKLKPNDSTIICNIGVCYYYLGQNDKAKEAFELSLRLNKDDEVTKKWLELLKED
ncbi:tetratricopeptide repeat protein [Thermobrachium celere]|uniref:Uncharacterized protein n=1 Tax=Thermobrachium celere DSM 8682 TaxID=941824 RepID=R7RNU0_9CLOT|nr:tetratricopeptide repeat protein [Thermobrachium celere]CDF57714.1 hypothetical protein TCEL_01628 [Thermobrachium celere DSM 8682]